jgi:acyl-CoA synthetase (AMP-forming)/AMP-acid ligase II
VEAALLLHHCLDYWASRFPDNIFTKADRGEGISYADADAIARQVAAGLAARGLGPGDRIGVLSRNSIYMPLAVFGSSMAGCTVVPLNPRLTAPELRYIVADAEAKVLFAGPELVETINAVRSELPTVRAFVTPAESAPAGWTTWAEWLQEADAPFAQRQISQETAAFQIYTSGTTGRPKGAVMSHRGLANYLYRWQVQGLRLDSGDVFFLPMPITLAAGFNCALNSWTCGATVTLAEFEPGRVSEALDEGAAATCMSPTMIRRCIDAPGAADRSYSALQWIQYGAAPIPAEVLAKAVRVLGCDFYQGFGQTEAPSITMLTPEEHRQAVAGDEKLLGSVGRVQLGVDLALLGPEGNQVPTGQIGEVCVRGPAVMNGYWKDKEGTANLAAGGWHRTRDLGYFDDDGYLFVVDRVDDMMITGGYNVYPREVEVVLEQSADVAQVAVFGVPSEEWGEEICAAVILAAGSHATDETLVAQCRGHLAGYKIPRRFLKLDELPMNANGKILKRVLREMYTSDREVRA